MNNHQLAADSQSSVYSIGSKKNLVAVKSKKSYFKKIRKKHLPIFVLASLTTLLSITVIVLSILYAKFNENMDLCDNEDCMRIAASLKESMNTSVDPCDDFYEYVCGRWPGAHPSLDLSQEHSWFREKTLSTSRKIRDLLLRNITSEEVPWAVYEAKTLFQSCMDIDSQNELGLTPIYDLLRELSIPAVPAAITKNTTDFVVQMAKLKRVLWTDVFFGSYIVGDPRNSKKNLIVLDLPDRENPFPSDKVWEKRLKHMRKKARTVVEDENQSKDNETKSFSSVERVYMSEVLKQIISNGTTEDRSCKSREPFSIVPEDDIRDTVRRVFELSALSNIYQNESLAEEDDISDNDYMSLDELQKATDEYVKSMNESLESKVIWKPFIDELVKGVVDYDPQEKVLIADLDYLKEVAYVLSSTDDDLLETAIWWTVIDYCVPYSSQALRRIWNNYVEELTGHSGGRSLSLYCTESINDLMGMAVAWLFVNPSFHTDGTSDRVREMLDNIKSSFLRYVADLDWMDLATKYETIDKNTKMKSLIGFPNWLFEDGELDSYYEGLNMSDGYYFDNMLQIIRLRNVNGLYDLANNDSDNDEPYWPLSPTEVNALHTFQENEIAIPAGILQFPFYGLGLEALNYGAIGSILGHELTHGFDNIGRRFDSEGNFMQWWTNETIMRYTDKISCFVDQYNDYYIPEIDGHIDGELTLGENIADNGGVREAFHAYQIWRRKHGEESRLPGFNHYTHDQLFFLGYGHMWCESYTRTALRWMLEDPHCPGHVRLRMVLRNSKHFSNTWNCPVGSNMNPVKKCQIW